MYENKLEFPGGGGGCKTKNLKLGEYGYFLELHTVVQHAFLHGYININLITN